MLSPDDDEAPLLPRDVKISNRQQWIWFLWLSDHTQTEIAEITGWSRTTVWKDLKEVTKKIEENPLNMEAVRQMALFKMMSTHAEIMNTIDEAKNDDNAKQYSSYYSNLSKLYHEASEIMKTVLERYTQPAQESRVSRDEVERSQIIIDWVRMKYGPEALDEMSDYYKRRISEPKREEA